MGTRYTEELLLGDEGVDYTALVCSRSRALFLPRPRQDIGIDGHIELLSQDRTPTGAVAFVQAKATKSRVSKTGGYYVKADKAHFETWSRYSTVVIGIVYNAVQRDARWVDISAHLRSNPGILERGPYNISAPHENVFSEENFEQFRAYVQRIHDQSKQQSAQELMDRILSRGADVEEALTLLFTQYRWTRTACYFVHNAVRLDFEPTIIEYLIYLMSFYRHNPDRFYTKENTAPANVTAFAEILIRDSDIELMRKMLSVIDPEEGIDRGTLGQMVALQFAQIADSEAKLKRLIEDTLSNFLDDDLRRHALMILDDYFQDDSEQRRQFYIEVLSRERDPASIEGLCSILEHW